jgi:hypothetical protein
VVKIANTKLNKLPGSDQIQVELIHAGSEILQPETHKLVILFEIMNFV